MITYQDLVKVGENERNRMEFVRRAINTHCSSDLYKTAKIADQYDRHKNVTISDFQKILYTVTGRVVPDNFSANWKMATRFFHRFVLQENQFLLGNGIAWESDSTKKKLGKNFDTQVQKAGKKALVGGVSFGFWNFDHLEVFDVMEFVPLYDEENGALMAGIRFWQIDNAKPLRATLYEVNGYTDYIWRKDEGGQVLHDKRAYIVRTKESPADGTYIYDLVNYPTLPIVPMWGNSEKQSEIVGLREQIDCYDLIKSGFANDIDDASMIYWTLQNAGGMDDVDLAQFVERMKTVRAAALDSEVKAEAHTMDVPYEAREKLLERLSKDLYRDAMALDTENISGGAVTATQIRAAYEPLNSKCDDFEYCVREFIDGILAVVGIENESPSFSRSTIINVQEEVQTIVQAASYLDDSYVTKKILTILGDGDESEKMLRQMDADGISMFSATDAGQPEPQGGE